MRFPAAALLLPIVLVSQNVRSQQVAPPVRLTNVRTMVASLAKDGSTPSIAVAVFHKDKLIWAEGFGLADRERKIAATADTSYRLASISKPFTATAVMQLAERGLLDLDQPANRFLGTKLRAMRGVASDITLRRLLNHTSGLPTHWNFFYEPEQPPPREQSIRDYGFAAFEPGTRSNYSNFAFGVLDHIVARVGKKPYRDWLHDELLQPLGMTHTEVGMPKAEHHRPAAGYERVKGAWQPVTHYGFDHDGASAIWSSANDLMRFARLQLDEGIVDGKRILAPELTLAMRKKTGTKAGSTFGIGWSIAGTDSDPILRHSGGMPGVSTQLVLLPARRLAVAVLTNSGYRTPTNQATRAILKAMAPDRPRNTPGPSEVAGGPAPVGSWTGLLAHPEGPIPVVLTSSPADGWQLGVGDDEPVRPSVSMGGTSQMRVTCGVRLPVGHAAKRSYRLVFELDKTPTGFAGVVYADARSTCRLPHWCELHATASKRTGVHRVITYNVLVGFRDQSIGRFLPGSQREMKISAWLAAQQPDVVALQEMNGYTHARLERLAKAWHHPHVALLKENGYPVAITSRQPITDVTRLREGLHHGMLQVTTGGIDYVVVHFRPQPGIAPKIKEAETALTCYRKALAGGREVIVLGDYNSLHPADTRRFSTAARQRYEKWRYLIENDRPAEVAMQPLLDAGAIDMFSAKGQVPAEYPLPRIDFILTSPKLAATGVGSRWLCEEELLRWSDHPPVVADFQR